jgi:hypothetical protein
LQGRQPAEPRLETACNLRRRSRPNRRSGATHRQPHAKLLTAVLVLILTLKLLHAVHLGKESLIAEHALHAAEAA